MKKVKKQIGLLAVKFRFWLSATNNIFYISFYRFFYQPRKNSLSEYISNYSKKVGKHFTVVQVGANDGFTNDPIHKYIKRDNWNGILLEPQPFVFNTFLKKLHRNSKKIIPINAALGETDGEGDLYQIAFSNSRWATGIASFSKEQLEDCFKSGHVKRCADKEGLTIPRDENQWIKSTKVEMISADSLLKKYNINKIDLLQIDAEGFDFEVIKLFKIEQTKPRAICFEASHFYQNERKECFDYLKNRNYNITQIKADVFAELI